MRDVLRTLSGPEVARVIEAHLIEQFLTVFAHSPRVEIQDEPDMIRAVSDVPDRYLNCVFSARVGPDDVDAGIDATLAHFALRRVPMTWRIGPCTRPSDLGNRLTAHGLSPAQGTIGMAIDLLAMDEHIPSPPGLRIEHVTDRDALGNWAHVVAIGFEYSGAVADVILDAHARPGFSRHLPWRLYLAVLEGEVVGASRIFLGTEAVVVSHLATLPDARGRGIGTAMTLAPLREARDMGYRVAVLHAAELGLGIYRRLGFREYCRFHVYVWQGRAAPGNGAAESE